MRESVLIQSAETTPNVLSVKRFCS
jgi:hypothetical protein